MSDRTVDNRSRHHTVLAQLGRDLERERPDRDVLATEITLSTIAVALDRAAETGDWDDARTAVATRLAAIGLDDATVAAFTNELLLAAGAPDAPTGRPRRRFRRGRR